MSRQDSLDELIERSSLGTRRTRRISARTPTEMVAEVRARVQEREAFDKRLLGSAHRTDRQENAGARSAHPGRSAKRPPVLGYLALAMVLLAAVIGAGLTVRQQQEALRPTVPSRHPVTVTVQAGQGSLEIGHSLQDAGVVDNISNFETAATERDLEVALKPGRYSLTTSMDIDTVLDALTRGPQFGIPVTIPPGSTLNQAVDRIVATGRFSKAEIETAIDSRRLTVPSHLGSVRSLEGLLFPNTYYIERNDTPEVVLQAMLDQLEVVLGNNDMSATPNKLTPYQIVIVASIIEREAKVEADRPKIAAVIYNRLRINMPLRINSTVEYALGIGEQRLTDADLREPSPYNTYQHHGLPPTPIGSPGEASIQAALYPAKGDWLFYALTSHNGAHTFTNSEAEFERLRREAKAKGLI